MNASLRTNGRHSCLFLPAPRVHSFQWSLRLSDHVSCIPVCCQGGTLELKRKFYNPKPEGGINHLDWLKCSELLCIGSSSCSNLEFNHEEISWVTKGRQKSSLPTLLRWGTSSSLSISNQKFDCRLNGSSMVFLMKISKPSIHLVQAQDIQALQSSVADRSQWPADRPLFPSAPRLHLYVVFSSEQDAGTLLERVPAGCPVLELLFAFLESLASSHSCLRIPP